MSLLTDPAQRLQTALSAEARALPESGIVEVVKYGAGRPGLIPLWVGEGHLPTPDFIVAEAARSMAAGETFYTEQRGLAELRHALAKFHQRQFGGRFDPEMFHVTGSGMQAIQMAVRAVATKGDEIVLPSPAWPNFPAAVRAQGAVPVEVPIDFGDKGWQLDIARLFDAVGPRTKAIFIISPGNPTGWVMSQEEMAEVIAFARARDLWLIADEVYSRFYFGDGPSPSFWHEVEPGDKILFTNTFSKNWAMTGWRVGWIAAAPELGQVIENMIQYSTSGVAKFMQRACVTALEEGEAFIAAQVAQAIQGRQIVSEALSSSNRLRYASPDGGFYGFFGIAGEPHSRSLAFRLIDEIGIGVAPGSAFGPGGEGFVRICFQRDPAQLQDAMDRIAQWLRR
ncbi:Aspartate aminotransferase [hydrothermal vent metagenome]|uniref:Aspartate aminotransferase n=1 Tax=hydrothermal vent metagenome TaxID=652676 RepID=A0A3B0SGP2_9ZZZZ